MDKVLSIASLLVLVAIAAVAFQSNNTSAVVKGVTGGFAQDLAAAEGAVGQPASATSGG